MLYFYRIFLKREQVGTMAKITVKLFASLVKYKPSDEKESSFEMTITPGDTVQQLILQLGLPLDKVQVISVNQTVVKKDYQLNDGDTVNMFPTIAGG